MAERKPQVISGYESGRTEAIVKTCLHLATRLGDFVDDLVIVGGIVPYLLVDQSNVEYEERHCGSLDVDLVLSVALRDEDRYEAIADRLRNAGFRPDMNEAGNQVVQRWRHGKIRNAVVDFLMDTEGTPGSLQHLTSDLAAFVSPGISLAFRGRRLVTLKGTTLDGALAERNFFVCGAGVFVLLKARAFFSRSERKDAYDIDYVLRNYGAGLIEIAAEVKPLIDDPVVIDGLKKLGNEFATLDSNGPIQLARFLGEEDSDALRADCSGLATEFVRQCNLL
jgi:hypothetical protein